jgi:tetratricopeptide (TPR) repeat protein
MRWSVAVNTLMQCRLRIHIATILMGYCITGVTAAESERDRYAARVKLLVEAHEQLVKEHQRIRDRKRVLQAEFAKSQAAVEQLQLAALVNRIRAQGLNTRISDARDRVSKWFETVDSKDAASFRDALTFTNSFEAWARELKIESRRIDNTGRVVIEHMVACIEQVIKLTDESAALQTHYEDLQKNYWALVDVDGQRSREELNEVIQELKGADDGNPAALLVRGVAFRRLKRFDVAQEDFERIINVGGEWQVLAVAARGECKIAQGKSREGLADISRAVRSAKDDPRVIVFQALALAADGKYANSEKSWKRLLVLGGYDVAAHRSLALLYSTADQVQRPAQALEHAEAACALAPGSDWSCLLALGAAKAANEDFFGAVELAQKAAKLAFGDKRDLCLDHVARYEAGEKPIWNWR